jgi:hypothetical protein
MKHLSLITLVLCFLAPLMICSEALAQRGTRTAPQTLDQLTQQAELIVRGSVVSARVEPHPQFKNLFTVLVTMNVDSTLKGTAGKTLQFRQYIWDIRDKIDGARYTKGSELLLMLGPVSPYGLRSPVGLEQGRFRILREPSGKVTAVNGTANLALLNVSPQAKAHLSARAAALVKQKPQGPLALADLEDAIRSFAGGTR